MLEHERLAVLAETGVDCDGEMKAWLRSHFESSPSHETDVHDIVSSARATRAPMFVAFVRERLGFDVLSERGATVTTRVLAELCERVLRGELALPMLGDVVRYLDVSFMNAGAPHPYPDGLGTLYSALDWCDDGWDLENQPGVREILETVARMKS